jgi:drug/metabolite transporter (DMT)-like permease
MGSARLAMTPRARTYALILLATVFWGGTAVAGKLVIQHIPPLTTGAVRYSAAVLLLGLLYWRVIPNPWTLRGRDRWQLLWIGVLGTFVNHTCFFFALTWAPAAHGALIPPTTSPVWTLLLAARLGEERVTRGQAAGIALCLFGVFLVVRPERLVVAGAGVLVGDALFLMSGLSWGVYSYLSKVAMRRLSAPGTLALGMTVGTVFLVPFALVERPGRALVAAPPSAWLALAYLAVAGTVLSFLWWNRALRQLGVGRTAIFSNLVPVFGVLISWLVLDERLGPLQLVGGGLAVLGVLTAQGASPWSLGASLVRARVRRAGTQPGRETE